MLWYFIGPTRTLVLHFMHMGVKVKSEHHSGVLREVDLVGVFHNPKTEKICVFKPAVTDL